MSTTRKRAGQAPWMEPSGRVETLLKVAVLIVIVLLVVYPFWTVLMTSLSSEEELRAGGGLVLFPQHPTLKAYEIIFNGGVIAQALQISVGVTVIGTAASVAMTVAMAYGLSRPTIVSRPVLFMALFTMLFSAGIIPTYLVVRQLGLINSLSSLVLPILMNAFNLVVMRQFFLGIPRELLDSAKIDGASELAVLFRIVLPLSKAVVAVITLFYAVAFWNSFFPALLYLNDNALWPLQLILRLYVLQGANMPGTMFESFSPTDPPPPQQAVQMAVVIVGTLPILAVYPFLQRYFTSGVLRGAIKG